MPLAIHRALVWPIYLYNGWPHGTPLTTTQEPTYAGFFRCSLGSGRGVVSICSGPSVGGIRDALTMVTKDAATILKWGAL